ncbi:MAG: HAD hydrolase family protein, partial [Spirochaetales bacterium]|nr:HAD hydrolase family protein [Spirochaetales bacterium]
AGCSVAMGNAVPEAKQAAKYITDTNNNDGVAKAIQRFVFDIKN